MTIHFKNKKNRGIYRLIIGIPIFIFSIVGIPYNFDILLRLIVLTSGGGLIYFGVKDILDFNKEQKLIITKNAKDLNGMSDKWITEHFEENDGDSIENAIIMKNFNSSKEGIEAKYNYLEFKYSNYQFLSHTIHDKDGKQYDMVLFKLPDGTEKTIYFDITCFFGKNP